MSSWETIVVVLLAVLGTQFMSIAPALGQTCEAISGEGYADEDQNDDTARRIHVYIESDFADEYWEDTVNDDTEITQNQIRNVIMTAAEIWNLEARGQAYDESNNEIDFKETGGKIQVAKRSGSNTVSVPGVAWWDGQYWLAFKTPNYPAKIKYYRNTSGYFSWSSATTVSEEWVLDPPTWAYFENASDTREAALIWTIAQ